MVLQVEPKENVRVFFDDISDFEAIRGHKTKLDKFCIRSPMIKKALIHGDLIIHDGEAKFRFKDQVYLADKTGVVKINDTGDVIDVEEGLPDKDQINDITDVSALGEEAKEIVKPKSVPKKTKKKKSKK